jgi:hypothetical protein
MPFLGGLSERTDEKHRWLVSCLAIVLWLAVSLVRVENERYALYVGMWRNNLGAVDAKCLADVKTRTGWWWHLYYGPTD